MQTSTQQANQPFGSPEPLMPSAFLRSQSHQSIGQSVLVRYALAIDPGSAYSKFAYLIERRNELSPSINYVRSHATYSERTALGVSYASGARVIKFGDEVYDGLGDGTILPQNHLDNWKAAWVRPSHTDEQVHVIYHRFVDFCQRHSLNALTDIMPNFIKHCIQHVSNYISIHEGISLPELSQPLVILCAPSTWPRHAIESYRNCATAAGVPQDQVQVYPEQRCGAYCFIHDTDDLPPSYNLLHLDGGGYSLDYGAAIVKPDAPIQWKTHGGFALGWETIIGKAVANIISNGCTDRYFTDGGGDPSFLLEELEFEIGGALCRHRLTNETQFCVQSEDGSSNIFSFDPQVIQRMFEEDYPALIQGVALAVEAVGEPNHPKFFVMSGGLFRNHQVRGEVSNVLRAEGWQRQRLNGVKERFSVARGALLALRDGLHESFTHFQWADLDNEDDSRVAGGIGAMVPVYQKIARLMELGKGMRDLQQAFEGSMLSDEGISDSEDVEMEG